MEHDLEKSFERLSFLVENPPFPQEAFRNLVLLYAQIPSHNKSNEFKHEAISLLKQYPNYTSTILDKVKNIYIF